MGKLLSSRTWWVTFTSSTMGSIVIGTSETWTYLSRYPTPSSKISSFRVEEILKMAYRISISPYPLMRVSMWAKQQDLWRTGLLKSFLKSQLFFHLRVTSKIRSRPSRRKLSISRIAAQLCSLKSKQRNLSVSPSLDKQWVRRMNSSRTRWSFKALSN